MIRKHFYIDKSVFLSINQNI